MNTVTTTQVRGGLALSIRSLGNWLLEELRFLLPKNAEREQPVKDTKIVIEYESGSVIARLIGEDSEIALPPVAVVDMKNGELNPSLESFRSESTQTIVRFSNDDVMTTRLTLPRATEHDLRSVLGFEMDRHTPFTAKQVYFDFEVTNRTAEQITLDLFIIPKSIAGELLDAMRAANIQFEGATIGDDETVRASLIPNSYLRDAGSAARTSHRRRWRTVLALALLVYLLPAVSLTVYNSGLQAEVDSLSAESADLLLAKQQLADLLVPSRYFSQLRNTTPRAIDILDELSRLVPDNTWVTSFRIEDTSVNIVGESADAAALIGLLDGSEHLIDSHFTSPVTRNSSTAKDRFSIAADIPGGWSNE
jgi:general secretion pathway protein L